MLNYQEFKEKIMDNFINTLPVQYSSCTLNVGQVLKVNEIKEALNVMLPDDDVITAIPTIYIQDLYKHYQECMDFDQVLREAADFFIRGLEEGKRLGEMFNMSKAKENIIFTLVNSEKNRHLTENAPTREFLDLILTYRWMIQTPDGNMGTTLVNYNLAKDIGVNEEELYNLAMANTPRILPARLSEMMDDFYILTNVCGSNGAATMLYDDILKSIAEKSGDDLFILPSSIHETIIMPVNRADASKLAEIVMEANKTVVSEQEMLSDSVYVYSKNEGSISLANVSAIC